METILGMCIEEAANVAITISLIVLSSVGWILWDTISEELFGGVNCNPKG